MSEAYIIFICGYDQLGFAMLMEYRYDNDISKRIPPLIHDIPCQNNNQTSIRVYYIYHKIEKGKPCQMDLPLLKNDIANILGP